MLPRFARRWARVSAYCTPGLLVIACANRTPSPAPELSARSPVGEAEQVFVSSELADLEAVPVRVADRQGRSLDGPELEPKRPMGPISYPEAVRVRDWQAALRLLEAAPAEERKRPEVRYLQGRLALELGDPEGALEAIANLEAEAPEFAAEVRTLRGQAHLAVGNADEVVAHYGAQSDIRSWLVVARALMDANRLTQARTWADKAVKSAMRQRSMAVRAEARALRAQIAEAQKHRYQAIVDYRWLALDAPTEQASRGADDALQRLDEKQRLNTTQRLQRARAFASAGRLDETERELELLEKAPGAQPKEAETAAVLAEAYYVSRRDYAKAAELYARAAKLSPAHREKHIYFEGNSLARAHRHQEAIARYLKVVKDHPRSALADVALYKAARLRFIDGQWKEAVDAYQDYLKRRGQTGRYVDSVRYELAVARLAAEQFPQAEQELRLLRSKTKSSAVAARLLQLEGVAQQGAGKREQAIATYHQVIANQPLTFEALLAAARLRQLGEPEPTLIPSLEAADRPASWSPIEVKLPDKVARLHAVGLDAEAEAEMRSHEPAFRREYGARSGEALCHVYGQLRSARRRYQLAQWAVSSSVLSVAPTPDTRWQWDCVYPQPYDKIVAQEEGERNLPPNLIYAVMRQESAFSSTVVSPAGAVGLMQIIEPTAQRIAQELNESYEPESMRAPATNVKFGAYYLRTLLDMFGGQVYLAAAAYNAGPHAATRWLYAGEQLPLDVFVARIPYTETRGYVYRVMGNWARYSYLAGGASAIPRVELEIPQGLRASSNAY